MGITKPIEWRTNEKGCHLVTSLKLNRDGYARVGRGGKAWLLHRYIYTQKVGEIPEGWVILHTCDEPSCINIEHLKIGTQQDNLQDMVDKGRNHIKTSISDMMKPKKIRELRINKGLTCTELAKRSNISVDYLSRVERHKYNGSLVVLDRIAKALNVSFNELFK